MQHFQVFNLLAIKIKCCLRLTLTIALILTKEF